MIRPARRLGRVHRVSEGYEDRTRFIPLDKNERTLPFSEGFINSLRAKMDSKLVSAYPEPEPLYRRLAGWLGVERDRLYLSSGSEYAIKALFEAYIEEGDHILIHSPSYAMYSVYSDLYGAEKTVLDYENTLDLDLERYISMIGPSARMAVLENPNGFVGNSYGIEDVVRFIEAAHASGVLAVIDEAYFHFCPVTAVGLVAKYDNLAVVRTFSKAFGLAGARLGYLVASRPIVESVLKVRPMHEITSFAVLSGLHCLEHVGEMEEFVKEVTAMRSYTIGRLKEMGIAARDTMANFILVQFPEGKDVRAALHGQGILVRRPFTQPFLSGWTRVTVGGRQEMDRLLEAVGKVI